MGVMTDGLIPCNWGVVAWIQIGLADVLVLLSYYSCYLPIVFFFHFDLTRAHHGFGWVGEWANTG